MAPRMKVPSLRSQASLQPPHPRSCIPSIAAITGQGSADPGPENSVSFPKHPHSLPLKPLFPSFLTRFSLSASIFQIKNGALGLGVILRITYPHLV